MLLDFVSCRVLWWKINIYGTLGSKESCWCEGWSFKRISWKWSDILDLYTKVVFREKFTKAKNMYFLTSKFVYFFSHWLNEIFIDSFSWINRCETSLCNNLCDQHNTVLSLPKTLLLWKLKSVVTKKQSIALSLEALW